MTAVTTPAHRHFAFIVLFASVVRATMLWFTADSLSADPDAYRRIACCLAETGTFGLLVSESTTEPAAQPTAFRPPLYPWLLSWFVTDDGKLANAPVAILHWMLGMLTVVGVFQLARAVQPSLTTATVAASLVAIDPLLLQSSSQLMTETLATALSTLGMLGWVKLIQQCKNELTDDNRFVWTAAGLVGLTTSLAYLCRPTFILWPLGLAVCLLGLSLRSKDSAGRRATLGSAAIILLVLTGFVSLWMWRNHRHFGKAIWATTHGGYTLLLGNNPSYYEYLRSDAPIGQAWDATFFLNRWEQRLNGDPRDLDFWQPTTNPEIALDRAKTVTNWSELDDDRLAYETATATVRRQPETFVYACVYRLLRLHSPMPQQHSSSAASLRPTRSIVAVTLFYTLIWLSVLLGLKTLGRQFFESKWLGIWLLWGSIAAVHSVYWTDIRMRAPLVPAIMLLAAMGLTHLAVAVLRKGSVPD